jgi:hypothetical protein
MRTTITALIAVVCLGTCGAAFADSAPAGSVPTASKTCKNQRSELGRTTFDATYAANKNAKNALGKCIAKATKQRDRAQTSARSACKAEQQDPNFAAAHGGKTFDQFYGTNKNGKNAFGKCVSAKARATVAADSEAVVNAAHACKAERKADPAAFKQKYGTNKHRSNAFGKCVAKAAAPARS